jgi:hypothetical protein
MFRRIMALSTPFYTPNVVHVDFSVETIPAKRKAQSFKFWPKRCYFVPYWDITAFILSFHSILHAERIAWISVSKTSLEIAKRSLWNFYEISVISYRIEILRHLNAHSTPFYTPNVVHVDFSVETIPANRKMQSFKFLRNLCHFVSDWGPTAFKHSFHSILHAECSACWFECRNNPCKSQNAIFQILTEMLLLRSVLRHYGVHTLLPLYSTRRTYRMDFSVENIPANRKTQSFKFLRNLCHFVPDWDTTAFKRSFHSILHAERISCRYQCGNNPCKSQNAVYQISTKSLLFRSVLK